MGLKDFTGSGGTGGISGGNSGTGSGLPSFLGGSDVDPMDLLINYNEKYKNEDDILFRDEVEDSLLSVLMGKNKPNALLIGSAGVGKTKIVEDIAGKIARDNDRIPGKLKKTVIYELPLSNIVSGSSFVGQVEEKTKAVVDFIADKKNDAILFIDEIHQIVRGETYEKIAQILKPSMARGEIRVIGATTIQESSELMNDPAFNRRFSKVIVDEFSVSQTEEILKKVKDSLSIHYDNMVYVSDDLIPHIVRHGDNYKVQGLHRPDNAVTLLDRAMGELIIYYCNLKKEAYEKRNINPPAWQYFQSLKNFTLTENFLKSTAVKMITGSSKKFSINKDSLLNALSGIKGQDRVTEKVTDHLVKNDKNLFPKKRPLTLLFAGPSGSGKTEITKIMAEHLTGVSPVILNMTEFNSPASINRIIGSPAGYVGYNSAKEMPFDKLETNPYAVILLDEFEKADRAVQRLFMSVFDEGYLTTSYGKTIDFSKCIIIATTNAGMEERVKSMGFLSQKNLNDVSENISALKSSFDVELLNRFRDILWFNTLTFDDYREILKSIYKREISRIKTEGVRTSLPDDMDDDTSYNLTENTYVKEFGARPAYKTIENYITENI